MAVEFGSGLVTVRRDWPGFKRVVDGTEKRLAAQAEPDGGTIRVFALDGPVVYYTDLYEPGSEPVGWTNDQEADNAAALADYQTNYASTVNRPAESSIGAKHYNGTATPAEEEVVFDPPSRSIMIQNMSSSSADELLVSLDGGGSFKTLPRLASLAMNVRLSEVFVKSNGANVPYEIVVAS